MGTQLSLWFLCAINFLNSGEIYRALCAITVVFLHVTAFGVATKKLTKLEFNSSCAAISVWGAVGLVILGVQMWLFGHLALWHPWSLFASSVICIFIVHCLTSKTFFSTEASAKLRNKIQNAILVLQQTCYYQRFLLGASLLILFGALIAGMQPPYVTDEVGYHWTAPLAWAHEGKWLALNLRYMNSACGTELLYLISAIFDSATAAHWTHELFFLVLLFGCAALAAEVGGSKLLAVAACCGTPVISNQIAFAYSDVAVAAIAVSGLVALLCSKQSTNKTFGKSVLTSAIAVAGVCSIKAGIVPGVLLAYAAAVFLRYSNSRIRACYVLFLLTLVCLVTLGSWCLHTYSLTGKFFDSTGVVIIGPNQLLKDHQEAIAKWPSVLSIIQLPMLPVITPFIGQQEPFGGRTGFVGVLFAPLLFYFRRTACSAIRNQWNFILAPCAVYFLVIGLFTVRTRYLNFSWSLLDVCAAVALTYAKAHVSSRQFYILVLVFCVCVTSGVLDSLHVMLHWYDRMLQPLIPTIQVTQ